LHSGSRMVSLVADRFLPVTPSLARDLATNGMARLRIERAAGDHVGWLDRCATLTGLWHPALAACLDFGAVGAAHRFEAYAVALPPRRAPAPSVGSAGVEHAVAAFLRACGVEPGALEGDAYDERGQSVVVPGPIGSGPAAAVAPADAQGSLGLRLVPRAIVRALAERLGEQASPGVVRIEVVAPPGSGGRVLLHHCAREGRRLGWVPVATTTIAWHERRPHEGREALEATLADRHVLLLHDGRAHDALPVTTLARAVLGLGQRSPAPRLLIALVREATDSTALRLEPLAVDELRAAVVTTDARLRARAARVAARCGGLPGRLVSAVMGPSAFTTGEGRAAGASRVHDGGVSYGAAAARAATATPAILAGALAVPRVRQHVATSTLLLQGGRVAAVTRALRRAEAASARRGDRHLAAHLALTSGRVLLEAGQWEAARDRFAVALGDREGDAPSLAALFAAGWLGRLRLDALDPDRSEALLRSAHLAARLCGARGAGTWISSQLARTLWWQGRVEDARALTRAPPGGLPSPAEAEDRFAMSGGAPVPPVAADAAAAADDAERLDDMWGHVAFAIEGARAALACGDHVSAMRSLSAARALASAGGAKTCAEVWVARAWWEAVSGDADALVHTMREGLRTARRARDRLVAVELRLVTLEGLVRAGRRAAARRMARRLARVPAGLPPLLEQRVRLAVAIVEARPAAGALRTRLVRRGIGACAPGGAGLLLDWPTWSAPRSPRMLDDVLEVVRVCQEEDDAGRALAGVARLLRARLRASLAAFLVGSRHQAMIADPVGARASLAVARRALENGVAVEPAAIDGATEAAVPIRFGGAVIGALACRWAVGADVDPSAAMVLLGAAATAVAPCLETLGRVVEPPGLAQLEAELLGASEAMHDVRRAIARAADAPYPVMILGESGVGKELVARAVHRASVRRARSFCAVNCAALPDELLEAELFGHARGAFTGAAIDRRGLFEEADGGVLFLDEVGELSPRGQAKLLRVLQDGEVRRLGELAPRRVDVRVVAATNRVLEREVEAQRFRRDLLYRLDVIRIVVPPLRERVEDVPVLAGAFWQRAAERVGSRAELGDAALAALARHDWPGNVRELQNVIAALVVNAPRRGRVGAPVVGAVLSQVVATACPVTLDEARRHFETRFIRAALARTGGHRGRAAAELGLTRQGLSKLMGRLGVEVPASESEAGAGAG
jgi:DNA-binding NtrC family response regulator